MIEYAMSPETTMIVKIRYGSVNGSKEGFISNVSVLNMITAF
jgi:hypothetical protein